MTLSESPDYPMFLLSVQGVPSIRKDTVVSMLLCLLRVDGKGTSVKRAALHLKADELCNFLNTCRMATPLRGCKAPSICTNVSGLPQGMVLKINPGIDDQFYMNPKNM
jgi:hypothetical protein